MCAELTQPVTRRTAEEIVRLVLGTCDPIVYGYGRPNGKSSKQEPHRANPLDKPPPHRDPFGKRKWATISGLHRRKHLTAARPLFTAGIANDRREVWMHWMPLDTLFARAGVYEPEEQAAQDVVANPRLLPRQVAKDALNVNPEVNPTQAERLLAKATKRPGPIRQLLTYLINLNPGIIGDPSRPPEPEWWLARRLLRQATGWRLTPKKWALITVDIDGDGSETGAARALELAASIVFDLFVPHDIPYIIEPSRSRTGSYIRAVVRLEDINAEEYNTSLDAFRDMLGKRYGTFADNGDAGVCSVKGKLAEWKFNPDFDPDFAEEVIGQRGQTRSEIYEWMRKNATDPGTQTVNPISWRYISELEPLILAGPVVLITAPLHGMTLDADGGKQRIENWNWLLDQVKHAPSACDFFKLLNVGTEKPVKAASLEKRPEIASRSAMYDIDDVGESAQVDPVSFDGGRVLGPDGWLSYTAAGRIGLRQAHGDRIQAAHIARVIREGAGMASGMTERDRTKRLKDSQRAVDYAARTYDISRSGSGGCTYAPEPQEVDRMKDLLEKRVPAYLVRFARENRPDSRLDMTTLAVVMVAIQHAMHDDVGERGAVPRNFLLGAIRNFTGKNPHNTAAAAAVDLLCDAGMLKVTRKQGPRVCRKFVLSRSAPLTHRVAGLPASEQIVERRPIDVQVGQMGSDERAELAPHHAWRFPHPDNVGSELARFKMAIIASSDTDGINRRYRSFSRDGPSRSLNFQLPSEWGTSDVRLCLSPRAESPRWSWSQAGWQYLRGTYSKPLVTTFNVLSISRSMYSW